MDGLNLMVIPRVCRLAALGLLAMVATAAPAQADRLAYRFYGTVVQAEAFDGVLVGDSIEGYLEFGTDFERQPPTPGDPIAYYAGEVLLRFTAGARTFEIPDPFASAALVQNGGDSSNEIPGDQLGFLVGGAPYEPAPNEPALLSLGLIDETGTALCSDVLPSAIDFSLFDTGIVLAVSNDASVSGVIDRIEAVTIPEPTPIVLLGSALIYLAVRRRRSRQIR